MLRVDYHVTWPEFRKINFERVAESPMARCHLHKMRIGVNTNLGDCRPRSPPNIKLSPTHRIKAHDTDPTLW